jgi:hypothetical protein
MLVTLFFVVLATLYTNVFYRLYPRRGRFMGCPDKLSLWGFLD